MIMTTFLLPVLYKYYAYSYMSSLIRLHCRQQCEEWDTTCRSMSKAQHHYFCYYRLGLLLFDNGWITGSNVRSRKWPVAVWKQPCKPGRPRTASWPPSSEQLSICCSVRSWRHRPLVSRSASLTYPAAQKKHNIPHKRDRE